MHVHVYVCVYTYVYLYMYICIYMCVYVYVYVHSYVYVHVGIFTEIASCLLPRIPAPPASRTHLWVLAVALKYDIPYLQLPKPSFLAGYL